MQEETVQTAISPGATLPEPDSSVNNPSPHGPGPELREIPTEVLYPSPLNTRKSYDIGDLVESIAAQGILQPITVRFNPMFGDLDAIAPCDYEVILGGRRYRAAVKLGLLTVPCIVRNITDEQAREMILVENLQREDVTPIEEARGFQVLIEQHGYSYAQLAERIGKSRSKNYVAQRMQLLKLEPIVQSALADTISVEHGVIISRLDTPKKQIKAMNRARHMNVKDFGQWVKEEFKGKKKEKPEENGQPSAKAEGISKGAKAKLITMAKPSGKAGKSREKPGKAGGGQTPVSDPHMEELRSILLKKATKIPRAKLDRIVKDSILHLHVQHVPTTAERFGVNVKDELKKLKAKQEKAKPVSVKKSPAKAKARKAGAR